MKPEDCTGCGHKDQTEQFKEKGAGRYSCEMAPHCAYFGVHLSDLGEIFPKGEMCHIKERGEKA